MEEMRKSGWVIKGCWCDQIQNDTRDIRINQERFMKPRFSFSLMSTHFGIKTKHKQF